jgi:4-amino-4-deoxy-L-arabinose transferase-like glycosyltransferase
MVTDSFPRPARRLILWVVAALVAIHLLVAVVAPYGFHRDEFLYMAMGRNLQLFAMDFPPLIAILSELQRGLLGDSVWSLRLAPALAHGATVLLTALMTARLGGGAYAQLLAMLAAATAPLFLRAGSLFQPVVFDQLWWTLALYALVRVAEESRDGRFEAVASKRDRGSGRHWILLGIACGFGLLTKFSILFFGVATLAAIGVNRRGWLLTPGPWVAASLALVIGAPSWIGQLRLGFPVISQMDSLREGQLDRIGYGDFLAELVLMHGPGAFLLAAIGAAALVASTRFTRCRVVGWSCLLAILLIMGMRGKPYYVGPVFPTLYAAGAVVVADQFARIGRSGMVHAARAAAVLLVVGWSAALLPVVLAVFPPEPTARFASAVGVTSATTTNQGVVLPLPQDHADMLGWEEKVARVAAVYNALDANEKLAAVIVPSNYGQAGAIDFYGPRFGLPRARAPIGSYWFWGPGEKPGDVVIAIGGEAEDLQGFCGELALATRIDERWVVPEERNLAIWICRRPPRTLQEIWPEFRGRN